MEFAKANSKEKGEDSIMKKLVSLLLALLMLATMVPAMAEEEPVTL